MRRPRYGKQASDKRGRIPDAVSISERPASMEDRAVPGHWEGDLICGPNNSNIVTLAERHSRYVMLVKIEGRDTETVVNALIRQSKKLPGPERGIAERSSPITSGSNWKPMSTSISATRKAPGREDRTKTPIECCDSTFQKAPTCRCTHRPNSTRSHGSSTSGQEKRWTLNHRGVSSCTQLVCKVRTPCLFKSESAM